MIILRRLLSVVLFSFFAFKLFSYPISPRPLRMLVKESQFIIIGFVEQVNKKILSNDGEYVAHINVLELLQGNLKEKSIRINFYPGMICPAPPRYTENTNVLVFFDEKEGEYRTHALSYGEKTLSLPEIEIYKARISEMQKILLISDQGKQKCETIEWFVKCAEQKCTRWEGSFELSPGSDFMSYYSQNEQEDFKSLLSSDQKDRIKKTVLGLDDYSYSMFGLIDLVYYGNETEMDAFLIKKLKSITKDELWLADDFMQRLKYKNHSQETKKILEKMEEINYDYDKEEEKMELVKKFVTLIDK